MKFLTLLILLLPTIALAKFSDESELSMVTTGGNSQLKAYNTKTVNKYEWSKSGLNIGGHYTYGESSESVSARNWDLNSRYEHVIHQNLSWTLGQVTEGNPFQGFNTRYNGDAGLKYYFIKTDLKSFSFEGSYRYTIEDRINPAPNLYQHKARAFTEYTQKYSETVQYGAWFEYIPNFTNGHDYLVNGEASITSILSSLFSLKVAYKGMYRNVPAIAGLKNYDYQTTTSLVAKF